MFASLQNKFKNGTVFASSTLEWQDAICPLTVAIVEAIKATTITLP